MTTLTDFDRVSAPVTAGVFALLFLLESAWPLRARSAPRTPRVLRNLAFALLGAAIVRALVITTVLAVARFAQARGLGLLALLPLPTPVLVALGLLLLDASMYGWHRLNHRVALLWRFHRVHHADLDLDVSTAVRFHPGELLLSVPFRALQTVLLGPSPALALGYELALQLATAFHHSNLELPRRFERALNALVVTPRMHQIHHSIVQRETDSNWSVVFSFWDRLARSFRRDIPTSELVIGLPAFREPAELTLGKLLLLPFTRQRPSWQFTDGTQPMRTHTLELAIAPAPAGERA
jgi:sterol desaturase/sphingolipid hydroxylase (fatty acid hydroxylase superfamily)